MFAIASSSNHYRLRSWAMESENTNPEQIINDARHRCHQVRAQVWAEGVEGEQISQQTHLALAQSVLRYHDALYEFRNDVELPAIEPLLSRAGDTTQIVVETQGWDRGIRYQEVPAVLEVSPERIIEIAKGLDDAANQIDFDDGSPDSF
mgnify:CR=1 FL=1